MNLHKFKTDEPALFNEAVSDIDWDKISVLLENSDAALEDDEIDSINFKLKDYLYNHFEAYYENITLSERDHDAELDAKRQKESEDNSLSFNEAVSITNMRREK